jgi:hypothetical protein
MADPKRNQNEDQDTQGRGDHGDQSEKNQGGQNWSHNPGQQSGGKDGKKAEGTATPAGANQNAGNNQGGNG